MNFHKFLGAIFLSLSLLCALFFGGCAAFWFWNYEAEPGSLRGLGLLFGIPSALISLTIFQGLHSRHRKEAKAAPAKKWKVEAQSETAVTFRSSDGNVEISSATNVQKGHDS